MKKMCVETYKNIEKWVMLNARPLEVYLWNVIFKKGSKEEVLSILSLYQNEDGGFGHGLEPDNWNVNSTPYTTLHAINILKSIEFFDVQHPIYQGIIKYISSGLDREEYGWRFNISSNDEYPHAPWWNYNEEANKIESTGITAELTAFILEYTSKETALYKRALEDSKILMNRMMTEDFHGDMGISGYIVLLEVLKRLQLPEFDYEKLSMRLRELVTKGIEHDTDKWRHYGYRPSNYISNPNSIYYEANKEIVKVELDYLIDTLPVNDVWPITWTWFENTEKYIKEFAISEVRWKAIKAIEKMRFLKNFGRIDF